VFPKVAFRVVSLLMTDSNRPGAGDRIVLLTGASRGYGRAMAESLAREAVQTNRRLHLLLVARDRDGLHATRLAVDEVAKAAAASSSSISSESFCADLSDPVTVEANLAPAMASIATAVAWPRYTTDCDAEIVAILNAGSVGNADYVSNISCADIVSAMNFNVSAMMCTTSMLLRQFPFREKTAPKLCIINVSSLLAVKEFPGLALYAAGKAARDMLMKAVTAEAAAQGQRVKTLSWAPGPMQTAMAEEIRDTCADAGVREMFRTMQYIDLAESAGRLMDLLRADEYESGTHIDVYDVPEACKL